MLSSRQYACPLSLLPPRQVSLFCRPVSASPAVQTTTFAVGMTCDGCANAVKRILGKIEGVASVDTGECPGLQR